MMKCKKNQSNVSQNIKVFVRLRPMNAQEKSSRSYSSIDCHDHHKVVVQERLSEKVKKEFTFDRVFDQKSTQIDVFKSVARPLVEEVLNGFSCTIFAYGQTASGKTFTMEGERYVEGVSLEENHYAGVIPRCVNQLFDELRLQDVDEFNMKVSFLELYNEELYDLLSGQDDFTKLRLYESAIQKGSCLIQGLEEVVVKSRSEVFRILDRGSSKRQTAATKMNDTSSRSHTVFTITVQIKENTDDGDELMKIGKLHLVDLAGSENIGRSGAVDKRAREAGSINISLLTLGRVITSLVEKAPHIPYRESKLTRLLQDALGGRTKTSIIATISPASINVDETLSTLFYASRAKNIKNCPEINRKVTKKEILGDYTQEIHFLKQALFSQREKDGVYMAYDQYEDFMYQKKVQVEEILEKTAQLRANEEEIEKIKEDFQSLGIKLCDALEELNETESTLRSTKETLQCSQKLLFDTAIDRDEQAYLVSAHTKTEEKLHSQGKDLINVATATTSDIEQLHNKLDRKRNVESTNEEIGEEFLCEVAEHVSSLKDNLVINMSQHRDLSGRMCDNLCNLSETQLEMKTLSGNLQDMVSIPSRVFQELGTICSSQINDSIERMNSYGSKQVHRCKDEIEYLTLIKQKKFDSLTRDMAQLISLLSTGVANNEAISKKISEVNEICTSTSEFSIQNLVDMHNKISEIQDKHLQRMKEKREIYAEQLKQKFDSQLDSIKKFFYCIHDEYATNMILDTAALENEAAESISAISQKMYNSAEDTMKQKAEESNRGALIAASANVILMDNSQEMDNQVRRLGECRCTLESNLDAHFSHSVQCFRLFSDTTEEAQQSHMQRSKSFASDVLEKVQVESTNFSSITEEQMTKLDQEIKVLSDSIRVMESDLAAQCESSNAFHSNHEDKIETIKECVLSLFSEKMSKDIPTGLTPNRREYAFPHKLTKTSPHDTIKQRFRAHISASSKIPLPLDPLDSKDESFKEPGTFLIPAIRRQESKEEIRSAPISRSSSASSISEMKENIILDATSLSTSLKKHIKAPSERWINDRPTRARKVLGTFNS